jgi:tight adherence protein B
MAAVVLAAALIRPERWVEAGLLLACLIDPRLGLLLVTVVGAVAMRERAPAADVEPLFLAGVAAQLRAGASVRAAIAEAAGQAEDLALDRATRLAAVGAPMEEVGEALTGALPASGESAAMALRAGTASGGRLAAGLDALVETVFDEATLRHEVRAATASARASAWLIGGLPVVGAIGLVVSGRLGALAGLGPVGWGMALFGGGLVMAGAAAIVSMVRGAEP